MQHETMTLIGDMEPRLMREWVVHRARKLSLSGGIVSQTPRELSLAISGPSDLLDAMEAACTLGPMAVTVDAITRTPLPSASFPTMPLVTGFARG